MKKTFTSFISLALIFLCHQAKPQNYIPKIAPLSPNVATLTKAGEYAANLYTGTPDIAIPLYEVKSSGLSVPISLIYNASGIRYTDQASCVGLGWALSHGGVISRSLQGAPDESFSYLSQTTTATRNECNTTDRAYINNLENGTIDGEPDIFSYSLPGQNGKFVLGQNSQSAWVVPYAPIKVSYNLVSNDFRELFIRDENGTYYQFGKNIDNSFQEYYENTVSNNGVITTNTKTAWYLREMLSANGTDVINFTYQKAGQVGLPDKVSQLVLEDQVATGQRYSASTAFTPANINSTTTVNPMLPHTITFPNGKVEFFMQDYTLGTTGFKKLDHIDIYEVQGSQQRLIRSIRMVYTFFKLSSNQQDTRLKLDEVHLADANGVVQQKYKFQYWTNTFSWNSANALDYWGFYNGITTNTNLLPVQTVPWSPNGITSGTMQIGGANRASNTTYAKEGVLKQITFPTGGYTEFDFESHRFTNPETQTATDAGGIRIKTIKSFDGLSSTPARVKTYVYGAAGSGLGEINNPLSKSWYNTDQQVTYNSSTQNDSKRVRTYTANQVQFSNTFDSSPVVYPLVTEYNGSTTANAGRTTYEFTYSPDDYVPLGSKNGELRNTFNYWQRGHLLKRYVYNAANSLLEATDNTYVTLQDANRLVGAKAFKHRVAEAGTAGICVAAGGQVDEFTYRAYPTYTGAFRLAQSTHTTQPGNIQKVSTFSYHPTELQLLQVKEFSSTGEEVIVNHKYPIELKAFSTVVTEMHNRNMLWPPLESETIRNGTIIRKQKSIYRAENNGRSVAPTTNMLLDRLDVAATGGTLQPRAYFNKYDLAGKLTQSSQADNLPLTTIYGYQNQLPIAEVSNADLADIAYTSFEADETGNWSIGSALRTTGSAPTGKKYYALGNGSIAKTGLTPAKTYVVSYWTPNATAFSVAGTVAGYPIKIKTTNGWNHFEHRVTGVSSISIAGTGNMDELRLHPDHAQMATYTYSPLEGVTTTGDANNMFTYYTYDTMGRLALVKDHLGNILQKYEYQYINQ